MLTREIPLHISLPKCDRYLDLAPGTVIAQACVLFVLLALLTPLNAQAEVPDPDASHARLYIGDGFPSATECGECHPQQYKQWSVSQHAYAQMSPVFNAMRIVAASATSCSRSLLRSERSLRKRLTSDSLSR